MTLEFALALAVWSTQPDDGCQKHFIDPPYEVYAERPMSSEKCTIRRGYLEKVESYHHPKSARPDLDVPENSYMAYTTAGDLEISESDYSKLRKSAGAEVTIQNGKIIAVNQRSSPLTQEKTLRQG